MTGRLGQLTLPWNSFRGVFDSYFLADGFSVVACSAKVSLVVCRLFTGMIYAPPLLRPAPNLPALVDIEDYKLVYLLS